MATKSSAGKGKHGRKQALKQRRAARKKVTPETQVTVTFRHVEPTPAIQNYAQRKLAHIAKFLKQPAEAHLILTVDKYRQHGEVTVKSGRLTAVAQEETKDLYSVIDLLAGNIERQIKRHMEKLKANKVRTLSTAELLSAIEEEETPTVLERIP